MAEILPLVDALGNVIGSAPRGECHGNPSLLHPVVHCHVFDNEYRLLLQLRSHNKDIQPGKWDTAVGGHVGVGESIPLALSREISEEIGLVFAPDTVPDPHDEVKQELSKLLIVVSPVFLFRYVYRNNHESELVHVYACRNVGPFTAQDGEVDDLRFWNKPDLSVLIAQGLTTPNFRDEYPRMVACGFI